MRKNFVAPNLDFLVVGTGRCGTGYCSKIFTDAGRNCGHEAIFTPKGPVRSNLEGDSSWLAVPWLHALPTDIKIVHVVRNPLKVLRSWLFDQHNVISLNPTQVSKIYSDYMLYYYDIESQETAVDKAAFYYLECNRAIETCITEQHRPYRLFRVEDDPATIIRWVGSKKDVDFSKWVGYNSRDQKIADDNDVLVLLQQSVYYPELKTMFLRYYPELEGRL